nr:restriction endonuclease subunit S [uncultured Campylobacter sp.]
MSKIFDLINEFCSKGVKFDELGVICKSLAKGTLKQEDLVDKGAYPVVNSSRDYYGFYDKYNNEANAFTIASRGEYAGFVKFIDCKFWAGGLCYPYTSKDEEYVLTKFIFYFLKSIEKKNMDMLVARGSIPALNKSDIDKVKIPVPPLEVQREIVRILDCFTLLTAELTAELTARKKQYEFYRDFLLSFDELNKNGGGYELKTLGSIADYSSDRIKFDSLNELNYVGVENLLQDKAGKVSSKYVPASGNCTKFESGDILVGNIRPYLKKIWQADCTGGASGDVLVLRLNDKSVNSRYLYQILADDKFFDYNTKNAKGAKMPRGNKNAILEYKIPVPSLPTQRKIVEILDKFDTLVNSIAEGLPCEIELRQKQYEYYREKLLNFTEIEKEI